MHKHVFHSLILAATLAVYIAPAPACPKPGDCYYWDNDNKKWVAYGCIANSPACTDCEVCNTSTCECDPTCVPPIAAFQFSPTTIYIGTLVSFDGSYSSDPDGTALVYAWEFGDDAFQTSGQGTDTASCRYRCIGQKTLSLCIYDNDDPDCDPTCPDHQDSTEETIDVGLPGGCAVCEGPMVISLTVDASQAQYWPGPSDCSWQENACGSSGGPRNISIVFPVPCYEECSWKFGVSASARYPWGRCDFIDVTDGELTDFVTAQNYCDIVEGFYYDPTKWNLPVSSDDPGTGTGCVISEGVKYSAEWCILLHEESHKNDFVEALSHAQVALADNPAFAPMPISENDQCSWRCQDALTAREDDIRAAVVSAYAVCHSCQEEAAHDAAQQCFEALAYTICNSVRQPNWPACTECDMLPPN